MTGVSLDDQTEWVFAQKKN